MQQSQKIVKNTVFLMTSEIITRILAFILIITLARYLGQAGLGAYSFIFAYIGLFTVLYDLGVSTFFTRELAKSTELSKKYLGNLFSIKLVLGVLVTLIAVVSILIVETDKEIVVGVIVAAMSYLFLNINLAFGVIFQSMQELKYNAVISIVQKLFVTTLSISLLLANFKLISVIVVFFLSQVLACCISAIIYLRHVKKFYFEIDLEFWKFAITKSAPFLFTSIFLTIYYLTDTIMLKYMSSLVSVGIYNAAYKVLDALHFIPNVIVSVTFPAMAYLFVTEKNHLLELYRKSFSYLFILAFPLGIGTTLLAKRILPLVYGEQFAASAIVLQILIWAIVFVFMSYIGGYLLNSANKQKLFTYTTATGAAINIVLNLILIPRYDYIGAAVATVVTEGVVLILVTYFIKSSLNVSYIQLIYKPIIAGIIMTAFILLFFSLNVIILVLCAIITYFSTLYLIGGIKKEDFTLITSSIKPNK